MAQRQFKSTDTSTWLDGYGTGAEGAITISADTADSARTGYGNTTATATSGSTALTAGSGTGFAAGDLILIYQTRNGGAGAGAWELNKISSVGAGTNWTLAYATVQAYDTTAQVYRLAQNADITINNTKTLTGVAWDGTKGGIIALFSNGTVTVTGSITGTAKGYRGATTHQGAGDEGADWTGEGTAGASINTQSANGNGGGGGDNEGAPARAGGAGGGNGAAASNSTAASGGNPATGGGTGGNVGLTIAVFGGGGGGQIKFDGSFSNGGIGGGFCLIIAKTITVTGTLPLNGGGATDSGSPAGGGGGAGGSILLKGQVITLGSSLVTANAGAATTLGSAGAAGRIHADYLTSITGTTSPTLDSTQDNTLSAIFGSSGLQSKYWG